MNIWSVIGVLTILVNVAIIFLLPSILYKYLKSLKESTMDLSGGFLIGSILLGQPVAVYENLIYLDREFLSIPLLYSLTFLKVTFMLAALAIILYNLHLLTIKGLPDGAVSFLMVTMGFATGAMVVGLQLDPNARIPIFYSPVFAGLIFIAGLMLFNIVGMVGLMLALNGMRKLKGKLISGWHIVAAYLFFVGPIFVFATRIMNVVDSPLNLLFFPFLLAFFIEMILFIRHTDGLPILGTINSIALLNMDEQVVVGGYHRSGNIDLVKMCGMAMLATNEVLHELIMDPMDEGTKLGFGFGEILSAEKDSF
ncbi:MAG: hypothetical protein D6732_10650, partial [Methanobacteriota archaeon]